MYDTTKPYTGGIRKLIAKTWRTDFIFVNRGIKFKRFRYPEVDHVDGIGTKGRRHWNARAFKEAVQDAVAMNWNDALMEKSFVYACTDHIVLPVDDHDAVIEIVSYLADECIARQCAITGGETSIQHNLDGMEISLSTQAFLRYYDPYERNMCQIGDIVIGIGGGGIHSNGLTLADQVLGDDFRPELIMPTPVYFDAIYPMFDDNERCPLHGIMHYTGGAYTKSLGILPSNADMVIWRSDDLSPQMIFFEIYEKGLEKGITDRIMYRTFNCGTGMILTAKEEYADAIMSAITGFKAAVIGKIVPGERRIKIESSFSREEVVYQDGNL